MCRRLRRGGSTAALALFVVLGSGCAGERQDASAFPASSDDGSSVPDDPEGLLDWIDAQASRPAAAGSTELVEVSVAWGTPGEELRLAVGEPSSSVRARCPASWSDGSLEFSVLDRAATDGLAGAWIQISRLSVGDALAREPGPPGSVGRVVAFLVAADGRTAFVEGDADISEDDRAVAFRGQDMRRAEEQFAGALRCP